MDILRQLWSAWLGSTVFEQLPPALQQPPGLWLIPLLTSVLLLGLVWLGVRRVVGSSGASAYSARELLREARRKEREGDSLEAGRAFEALGKHRKALKVYRRGEHHEERALLLLRLARRKEAKAAARDGGEWRLYGELCQEDGDLEEAAVAYERAGQAFLAGQCYAELERSVEAARCYLAAGLEAEVVRLLKDAEGPEPAELLDQAIRASLRQMGGSGLSLELQEAVQRGVQLWLSLGQPKKAFQLAVDSDRLKLAVPVARDYLEPSVEAAELCARAGAHRVAADIYGRLGEEHLEAQQRAEDAVRRDQRQEAAEWLEKAEDWAAAADHWAALGQSARAAKLFARAGDPVSAAQLQPVHTEPSGMASVDAADARTSGLEGPGAQPWLTQAHLSDLEQELATRAASPVLGSDPFAPTIPSAALGLDVGGKPLDGEATAVAGLPTPSLSESSLPTSSVPRSGPPDVPRVTVPTDLTPKPLGPAAPKPAATVPISDPSGDGEARYRLGKELGRGGMGVVYEAEDLVLQRPVALKILPEHMLGVEVEPESLLAEARAAARLSHPNIVQVYDAGRRGRGFFVVMELIRGQSLDKILEDRQITVAGALRIGLQICAALDHAHGRHIVHRDLKPSNLMWSEERVLKLADFGLARAFEASQGRVVTQPAGTPSYMAPEQIRGEGVSPQADIYSFGCVLFELLCRESVFGTGPPSFHHHLASVPRDPRGLRPEVPDPLADLILSCLAKDPSERPRSAADLGRELAAILKTLG